MHEPLTIEPAHPGELEAAFRLLFQYLPAEERDRRAANAGRLVRQGELDPAGVLVARGERGLVGAMACTTVPGAGGLVWPPQALAGLDQARVEDELVRHAEDSLRRRGAKLAQSLLQPADVRLGAALERSGYRHVTSLWYMRHNLELPAGLLRTAEHLTYQAYDDGDSELFQQTLLRTYEGTADCPEVNGVRTIGEVIEGHRAQGKHDPGRWWLAVNAGRPVGVLLLTDMPEWGGWDVSYVGVVPEDRRRGVGRELMQKALLEAKAGGAGQLTLSVDNRNGAAWDLYRGLGFEPFDRREVFVAIWR
jgi:mycothiol synthase